MESRPELLALGQAIRRAREQRGWTQAQLAAESGVSDQTILRTELGRHAIAVDHLWNISSALGLRLPALISDAELNLDNEPEPEGDFGTS